MNLPSHIDSPQKNKPTAVLIAKENWIILTNVGWVSMRIFNILLHRKKWFTSLYAPKNKKLYKFKNLSSIWDIELVFVESKDNYHRIELPEEMKKNLALYLKNKQEMEENESYYYDWWFDCKSFTDFLNGWEKWDKLDWKKINFEDIYDLPIWTTIMTYDRIEDKKYKAMHYWIVIWKWIILSKLWHTHNWWEIAITTVEELQKVYSFNHIWVINKK